METQTALHLFSLGLANGAAPDWIQLTPNLASFISKDGRGPWVVKNPASVIRASLLSGQSIRIDYNHAIDLAAKAGFPSPAAGWIEDIAEHGPNNEPGLWGRVKWTPAGAKSIVDGEYRYISPVLLSAKNSDELVAIGGAALTNDPALVMQSLFSTQEMSIVNRQALCDALSLPGSASDNDIVDAVKKGSVPVKKKLASALGIPETATDDDLMTAVKRVGVQASTLANVTRLLAAAGLTGDALDEPATVALCAKLKGAGAQPPGGKSAGELQTQVDDLQKQLASLSARLTGNDAKTEVEAAITAGKLTPAQKEWAIDYCARDADGFKKFVGAAPRIVSAGALASHAVPEGELAPHEKQLCAQLGVKEEDYKKTRAAMAAGKAAA